MFYEFQPQQNKESYKEMLKIIGSLSRIFSESASPYLYYRAHENIFCKYLNAINLSREDCTADAKSGFIGIGLKTWVGSDDQKIAEFGELRPQYAHLDGVDLVATISAYRNQRIAVTMRMHNLSQMLYHVVKRVPHQMHILECPLDFIDIQNIRLDLSHRANPNNIYFTDGRNSYHFSKSKNTLYKLFFDLTPLDYIDVEILNDPYFYLYQLAPITQSLIGLPTQSDQIIYHSPETLCLKLYSFKSGMGPIVYSKSGLNQWNAGGRARNPDEIYIPFPADDRLKNPNFFPPRDIEFTLYLPDGTALSAKVCQDGGKAIMSNPNNALGKWLLRDVLGIPYNNVVTYADLQIAGIDSVIFTKLDNLKYKIDFCKTDTIEQFNLF